MVQTQALQVSYATPLPGIRGWFKKGEFVAVKGATLQLLPGRTLGVVGGWMTLFKPLRDVDRLEDAARVSGLESPQPLENQ